MKKMEVAIENCPLCGSKDLDFLIEPRDWRGSDERFKIVECRGCSFKITNPRPADEDLGAYYPSDSYVSHTDRPKGLFDRIYFEVQKRNQRDKLRKIQAFCTSGSLLDYGCGAGSFMAFMQQNAWEVTGVEINDEAAQIARERTDALVQAPDVHQMEKERWDVITLWHVLEHLSELEERMAEFESGLKKGGHLFLALPNNAAHDAKVFGSDWAAWDVPIHLWHFDRKSMHQLANRFKLEWTDTLPMPFDSYYVSMISAKNQKNPLWPLKGLTTGYSSNRRAIRTGEASSLIYVLKKPE
jgi:SAM-dependent methyltransferase